MKKSKTTCNRLLSFGLKQKIRKNILAASMLMACISANAQWGNTKLGGNALNKEFDCDMEGNTAIGSANSYLLCGNNNSCVGAGIMFGALGYAVGNNNSALGLEALYNNTSGSNNSTVGINTLYSNTTGSKNSVLGDQGLFSNTTGYNQVAIGASALYNNTIGSNNVAVGYQALTANKNASFNTAVGYQALYNNAYGAFNTAIGYQAKTSSSSGINSSTAIGYGATVNTSNKIRLGGTNVTVVEGPVYSTVSDGRFKTNISETEVKGLEFIKKLRPVVYNFDTQKFDEFLNKDIPESERKEALEQDFSTSTAIRQSGFIAQEVEVAAKEAGYNFNGVHVPENANDNYSLAYGQFVVPLVKAVQELSKQNEELKKELDELKKIVKNNSSENSNSIENSETSLFQNAPNPFNESTTIKYSLSPLSKKATLTIVSINGQKVKEFDLTGRNQNAVEINAGELAPGTYVYSLMVNDKVVDTKKMTLTK